MPAMKTMSGQEFVLARACSVWPLSEARLATVRAAAIAVTDWERFLQVVKRHRIAGLVHNALVRSAVSIPPNVAEALALQAQAIARNNLSAAAETLRLQRIFDDAQIPVVFFKGVSLAQLAYGSLSLKHGRDIDLLVPPEKAEIALRTLEADGYALCAPAEQLSDAQRRALVRYTTEFGLIGRSTGLLVEIHWRLTSNPCLLRDIDVLSATQDVALSAGSSVRTLTQDDLFAYLCAHGAMHAWSRLKWLTDLNALIAGVPDSEIVRLYTHAEAKGAGLCAGQALLLCKDELDLDLPAELERELRRSKRLDRLLANARHAMVGHDGVTELEDRPFAKMSVMLAPFLLGTGPKYFFAQLRAMAVGYGDIVALPLPERLYFLYPLLRPAIFLWRRWNYLLGRATWYGSAPRKGRIGT